MMFYAVTFYLSVTTNPNHDLSVCLIGFECLCHLEITVFNITILKNFEENSLMLDLLIKIRKNL